MASGGMCSPLALVLVPLATAARNLGVRAEGFVGLPDTQLARERGRRPAVCASARAWTIRPGGRYHRAHARGLAPDRGRRSTSAANTRPGEPIFVYPTAPLLYVLADRPNPTRFAHLYPGAASPSELASVIGTLETRPGKSGSGVRVAVALLGTTRARTPHSRTTWRTTTRPSLISATTTS